MDDDELTDNDVKKLFEVFRNQGGTIDNKIICDYGRELGYNQHQVHLMMEKLLNFGYVHEPIQGHYAMTRDIKGRWTPPGGGVLVDAELYCPHCGSRNTWLLDADKTRPATFNDDLSLYMVSIHCADCGKDTEIGTTFKTTPKTEGDDHEKKASH